MSDNQASVVVTPKTRWESRTNIYNAFKAAVGYISAVLALFITMAGQGTLPFEIDLNWVLFGIAFLAITDGHVGMWLRGQTEAPIVSK